MQLDRPKDDIVNDMKAQAAILWGPERADALRAEIEKAADWIAQIARHPLDLDGEEPDFLIAPGSGAEGER